MRMPKREKEREVIEAEEIVGAYLFLHPEALHVPYSLKALNYRARSPYFAELLQVAASRLSGVGVNFRAHLSTECYRFWSDKSTQLALSPTAYEQVADALTFLCDVARYDMLKATLHDLSGRLTPRNISVIMHGLLERMAGIIHTGSWQVQTGETLKNQYLDRLKRIHETKNFPLYTHLPFFDAADIFLPRREYTLISGRTGVGKTSLACILAYNLLFSHEWNDEHAAPRPLNILYISLEVPAEAILAKILGTFTHKYILPKAKANELTQFSDNEIAEMRKIGWNDFYAKTSEKKFELTVKIVEAFLEKATDRLSIYHSPVLTGDDIVLLVTSRALELASQDRTLDVVIIDFIQNLRTRSEAKGQSKEGMSLTREIGHTIQELQQVFSKFEICGIVLSQVNDMGEVRDSRVVEHLSALHIKIGSYSRDFTPLFESYYRQSESGYIRGKPANRENIRKEAQRLNDIAQKLPHKRLLDFLVTKNRYGAELKTPHLITWKPAIPVIAHSYDLGRAVAFLEKVEEEKGSVLSKNVTVEPPPEGSSTTEGEMFPF
jgi:replicative DNA helicase